MQDKLEVRDKGSDNGQIEGLKSIISLLIIVTGTFFVYKGLCNNEQNYVLQKAIRICMECIGIG